LFAEQTGAGETNVLGAAKEIAAGFSRSTGTGIACVKGINMISLRKGGTTVICLLAPETLADAA
jgi:hypothetical protein